MNNQDISSIYTKQKSSDTRSTLDHSPSYYLTGNSSESPPVFVTDQSPSIGDGTQVLDDRNNNNNKYSNDGVHQRIVFNNKRRKSHHQTQNQQQLQEPAPQTGVTTATSNQSMFIPDPLRSCVIETDVSSYLQAPSSGQVHLLLSLLKKSLLKLIELIRA